MPKEKKSVIYQQPNHLSYLERMRADDKFSDVTIQIDEQRFNAHRVFLTATVPFFEKMFTTDCREQKDGVLVVLKDIKAENMELLLMFVYTGKIDLNEDNVESLMFDADFLGLTDLADECAKFLETCINNENVLAIKNSAELLKYDVLQNKCFNYILQNFTSFAKTDQFLQFSIDDLEKIILSQGLQVASEEQVYTAMMCWLNHDVNERKPYLPRLLKCVRLINLDAKYLINRVLKDELIASSEECKDIINAVIHSRIILKEQIMPNEIKINRDCETTSGKLRIAVVCENSPAMLMYNPMTVSWERFETNVLKSIYSSTVLQGELYGISNYHLFLMCITDYESHTCNWNEIGQLKSQKLFYSQVVALGDYLYVLCGGVGIERNNVNLVKRYCPQTEKWKTMAPMNTVRSDFQAVACQGYIYVCGGFNEKSIECYDPSVDQWTIIDISIKEARARPGMVVLNNKIYICGGYNESDGVLDTVEVFDPKLNTLEYIANMNRSRAGMCHNTVAYQGKLWVIGGLDDNCEELSSVELYDPETNSWQYGKSLPTASVLCGGIITIH